MKMITVTSVVVGSATGTLTSTGTPNDGDQVVIGSKTYTFKTVLGTTEGNVKINGSAANALLNLKAAINHLGSEFPSNGDYYCAAANTQVLAGVLTASTLSVTALDAGTAGNAIVTTETSANLSWGSGTLTGGTANIVINGTWADATITQPAQQVTVGEYATGYTAWSRGHRLQDVALRCIRSAVQAGIYVTSMSKIFMALERTLSFVAKITTQPVAASCVHSSTAATFTVVVTSELTASYQWQYSLDGTTLWTNATGTINGTVYTNDTTASLTCTPTTTGQNGYFHRCQITNGNGVTTTSAVVLTIT